MNSCLYRCHVMHNRLRPKRHRFRYPCFVFKIDLDEIADLQRSLLLFSHQSSNLYSLLGTDHLQQGAPTLKENVLRYLRGQGFAKPIGRVELITNLRVWGYVFNPVSFYFVYDTGGSLACVVAEVGNTFHEKKLYLVEGAATGGKRLRQSHRKLFYVSPFSELDTHLNFDLRQPEDRINLIITENDCEGLYFASSLQGERRPLTNRELLLCTLRFPLITLQIIAAIHWQAALLYLKRTPFFSKNHRTDQQQGFQPPLKAEQPTL